MCVLFGELGVLEFPFAFHKSSGGGVCGVSQTAQLVDVKGGRGRVKQQQKEAENNKFTPLSLSKTITQQEYRIDNGWIVVFLLLLL